MRRLFGGKAQKQPERYEPWERLVSEAPAAIGDAREVVARVAAVAAPELSRSGHDSVTLRARDAADVIESFLAELTRELRRLCAPYDYRQIFLFSRLCINLPVFRSAEHNLHRVWMRVQTADLCAVGFGSRILGDFVRIDDGGYSLGRPPDTMARDVVKLHELARRYRLAVVTLIRFNYLRVFAGENGGRHSPTTVLQADGELRVAAGSEESEISAQLFEHRYTYNRALSLWGVAEDEPAGYPLTMVSTYSEEIRDEPYGGEPFRAEPRWFNEFLEHVVRFRRRFEEGVGLPVEHLYGIMRALYKLAIERGSENDAALDRWGSLTGTLLISRRDLLEGPLEGLAEQYLGEFWSRYEGSQTLKQSIERFVDLAVSREIPAEASASREEPHEEIMFLRALWPPSFMHGEGHHDTWLVDFASSYSFLQRLADMVEVTEKARTTESAEHDADVRTSAFDLRLAKLLRGARGVKPASFPDKLYKPDMPNIVFTLADGTQREIDVPVRIGQVLVAVQTWASEVEKRMEGGDHDALKERWRRVRRKLKKTDERYARHLLTDPDTRRYLKRKGIRYVLPVFCSPFAEPVISTDPKYWLRHISEVPCTALPLALPRIVTPPELGPFLDQATEDELKRICVANEWEL